MSGVLLSEVVLLSAVVVSSFPFEVEVVFPAVCDDIINSVVCVILFETEGFIVVKSPFAVSAAAKEMAKRQQVRAAKWESMSGSPDLGNENNTWAENTPKINTVNAALIKHLSPLL